MKKQKGSHAMGLTMFHENKNRRSHKKQRASRKPKGLAKRKMSREQAEGLTKSRGSCENTVSRENRRSHAKSRLVLTKSRGSHENTGSRENKKDFRKSKKVSRKLESLTKKQGDWGLKKTEVCTDPETSWKKIRLRSWVFFMIFM